MIKRVLYGYLLIILFTFVAPVILSINAGNMGKAEENNKIIENTNNEKNIITVFNTENDVLRNEDLEEYLIGVVAAEMPALYEPEALKAQAVAARSYIMSKSTKKNDMHPEAIVCDNPDHCEAYINKDDAKEKWEGKFDEYYKKIKNAVSETEGEYLVFNNKVIDACFFALSNGKTESSKDIWGSDLPYLVSVKSEHDLNSPNFLSKKEVSKTDFNKILGFDLNSIINIGKIEKTTGDRVKNIEINKKIYKGSDIRNKFSLNSTDFEIKEDKENVIFTVKGKGHGVGMSQFGANELAKNGKNYKEILQHYYSGTKIEKNKGLY